MSGWKTLKSEVVYETPGFKIYRDEVLNHKGKQLSYSYMRLPHPVVTVIAVDPKGCMLRRNYRHPLKQTIWEVPTGHSDGENPLVAAKRKLLEEAGLESSDWSSLGEARLACGVVDIHDYLILARDASPVTTERDKDEDITDQHFVTIDEVKDMTLKNEIVDADSLIGLDRYIFMEAKE